MTTTTPTRATRSDSTHHAPIDLALHPQVEALLVRQGWGPFVPELLTSPPGRNATWTGLTASGAALFVKLLLGVAEDIPLRMARVLSFQRFADAAFPRGGQPGPRLVAHDLEAGVVVFELVPDARGGAELMVDEAFTESAAHLVGRRLAAVHGAPVAADAGIDTLPIFFPTSTVLRAVPSRMFETLSFGEIQAWSLLQRDPALIEAVERLEAAERDAPAVPTHCDLRMDQLLFADDTVLVTDWEEFRLSDAARDVGAFAGEWLYRSILDIVTTRGGQVPVVSELSHEEVLRRGVANLERLTPCVRSFWRGYREVRPELDPTFVDRATAFAGWHTIDRLLAGGTRRSRLSGIERAAAGIGRSALVSPSRFSSVIGLGEPA